MSKYPNNWAVVVPLANEEAELPEFAAALRSVMDSMDGGTVYFVVDRVSKDRTLECCQELESRDPRFITKWIPENRNVVDAYINGFREALKVATRSSSKWMAACPMTHGQFPHS